MQEAWKRKNEENVMFLNFDDGYLDNWVHAFPILQYYGLKGTVYVTSDFIDPRSITRPQKSREESLAEEKEHTPASCCAGFLSYPEMRAMEKSGIMEIQAHAQTHTWYASGPEIIDFWKPGSAVEKDGPIWMLWNKFPETKPLYLTDAPKQERLIPYGTPVLQNAKSLEVTQFFPEQAAFDDLSGTLADFVTSHGGRDFFSQEPNYKSILLDIAGKFGVLPGHYETDQERYERVCTELRTVKTSLEKNLDKEIFGICWPGGGVTEKVADAAKEMGYRYFTMPSRWKKNNCPESCKNMLPRFGTPRFISVHGKNIKAMRAADLSLYLWCLKNPTEFRKSLWHLRQILALAKI